MNKEKKVRPQSGNELDELNNELIDESDLDIDELDELDDEDDDFDNDTEDDDEDDEDPITSSTSDY